MPQTIFSVDDFDRRSGQRKTGCAFFLHQQVGRRRGDGAGLRRAIINDCSRTQPGARFVQQRARRQRAGHQQRTKRRAWDRRPSARGSNRAPAAPRRQSRDTVGCRHLQRLARRFSADDRPAGRQDARGDAKAQAADDPRQNEHAAAHAQALRRGLRRDATLKTRDVVEPLSARRSTRRSPQRDRGRPRQRSRALRSSRAAAQRTSLVDQNAVEARSEGATGVLK